MATPIGQVFKLHLRIMTQPKTMRAAVPKLNSSAPRNQERIEEEIGDLFFATVNLSRHLKCNAEEALRKANNKFEQRFRKVEEKALERGVSLKNLSLIEMDILWDEVKKEEK